MLKRIDQILTICSAAFVGVFLGHFLYLYFHVRIQLEFYAMNSAPWYTSAFCYGIVTAVVLIVCFLLKWIVRRKLK